MWKNLIKVLVAISLMLGFAYLVVALPKAQAHDEPAPLPTPLQFVMAGPFADGRVVWCKGREESGNLVISEQNAASCRMDTTDVHVAAPVPSPVAIKRH